MGETKAKHRPRSRRWRQTALCLGIAVAVYCLVFVTKGPRSKSTFRSHRSTKPNKPLSPSFLNSLFHTEKQCLEAFPGLVQPIDETVAEGPFMLRDRGDLGPLQGRIKDGKLYIISTQRKRDLSQEMVNSRTAALHQLQRALLTSPEPLPDTVFALNFQDQPFGTAWGYSAAANPQHRGPHRDDRAFLMPHFSFWAWNLTFVGSMSRAARAIDALEAAHPGGLASKLPRAVWRGTHWYNSVHNPQLRQNLLAAAKGKPWADVQTLAWNHAATDASNALRIEDFCRYRYVLHTEGVAYSGRFQFHQMCASVTLTPPIQWLQHTTHLVRPLFANDVPELHKRQGEASAGRERARRAWPVGYAPEEANIVFVASDWSDLEDTVEWLERNPEIAQGIARRQRELFAGGGYFSPAAEACYWRALVRGWSRVVRFNETEFGGKDEVPYEAFVLTNGD